MKIPKVTLKVELDEEDLFGTLTSTHYDTLDDTPEKHVEPKYLFMVQGNKFEFTIDKYFINIALNGKHIGGVYKAEIIQDDVCFTVMREDYTPTVDIVFTMNDENMRDSYIAKDNMRGKYVGKFDFDEI